MDAVCVRRKRLEQLLELSIAYRGWTRKELAKALGRDPTKLVPGSGIPKLDLVTELARVLDWPVGDVVSYLWTGEIREVVGEPSASRGAREGASWKDLDQAARAAHREGRYGEAVELARQAYRMAETPDERVWACIRELVGWDGLGHYATALAVAQRGLQEAGVAEPLRRVLASNLANAHYTLWALNEARSLARDLIDAYTARPPDEYLDRCTQAFGHYVRGHALRRSIATEPQRARAHAEAARADLERAERLYVTLGEATGDESFGGIANTCRGGIIEVEAAAGDRDASSALTELTRGLEAVVDPETVPPGDWLESYGWWCIFGCNVVLRHVGDEREVQRHMAVFTNKADEIAERMNNWSLRERVFTMQYLSHERFVDWTGRMVALCLDDDDVRDLVGAMGRFPAFRETGWRLLKSARVLSDA
ncbi:MAG: hypothetical protein ACYS0D_04315 [Planctomycetota bacterium]|jgi:hypothetical protein